MKAAIVTIGDEILIGQIVDTNSSFIAKSLDKIGIEISEMLSISDQKQAILDTLTWFQNKVDLVVITGGLGPTKDDITKKTFCDYFDDQLQIDVKVLAHVTQLIEGFYQRPITTINKEQALVPTRCTVLHNQVGTAPGMWMQKDQTVFISLPGVPFETKYLMENEVIPRLISKYKRPYILHKTILTYGMGESLLAEKLEDWENNLPEYIKLAYLPSPGRVRLRLSARGTDKALLENGLATQIHLLHELIGDTIVGYDDSETIEVVVGQLLKQQKATIATAESCTGGKIAQLLSSVAGASGYFKGSIVCYDTAIKTTVLKVAESTLATYGVVSQEVAEEMAHKVKHLLNTDYAIATTGNAGPSKGDLEKKIGTVCIAIAGPKGVFSETFNFGQPREKVIERASIKGLEMIQKEILKNI
ncbi:competence/damage-inducible protein A [Flavobacterium branchiophilum]|uniref:CinA-like protein n=1 Tax=Flavobacterium branchiophilum (strain FL-15) TaxID=1034807 RepID=G2Z2G9_FLABF|nr:competence/damage-inducible protein A [Flavobacterium branchiophilum]CCB70137.1 CinA-like protein [Flavobacterium branchiophilum FL-15]